ncbi:MAG: redoxin domain-containing protein [Bacteroidota bacterium]
MQKFVLFLALLSAVFVGCESKKEKKDNHFLLKGKLKNAQNISFSIEELTPQDLIPIDSINTDNDGKFAFKKDIEEAGFYIIKINRENSVTLLVEPGEEITMNCNADSLLETCNINGSEGSQLMLNLNRQLANSYKLMDSLAILYRESRYSPDFDQITKEINIAYTEIFDKQREFNKTFIEANKKSLASIIALNQYLGDKMLLTMRNNFEYFDELSNSLSSRFPSNRHVLDLKKQISNFKRRSMQRKLAEEQLAIGKKAPEIIMNDPESNPIALSSLRGKVVLIDFWATWCPPCRQTNKELKSIYEEYESKGFEIYGISLDRQLDEWLQGIEEDNITWTQVSDLRFWNSPVVSLYNVEGIPHNVLIDKDGLIIDKGISTNQLEKILDEKLEE